MAPLPSLSFSSSASSAAKSDSSQAVSGITFGSVSTGSNPWLPWVIVAGLALFLFWRYGRK